MKDVFKSLSAAAIGGVVMFAAPVALADANKNESGQELSGLEVSNKAAERQREMAAIDEEAFAPKTKADTAKVEMPTVFTEKQKELFEMLSPEEQSALVEKLVKKHGYASMYPSKVQSKTELAPEHSQHVEWCLNKYRSYRPRTDTFRGYDGYNHRCISPYSDKYRRHGYRRRYYRPHFYFGL